MYTNRVTHFSRHIAWRITKIDGITISKSVWKSNNNQSCDILSPRMVPLNSQIQIRNILTNAVKKKLDTRVTELGTRVMREECQSTCWTGCRVLSSNQYMFQADNCRYIHLTSYCFADTKSEPTTKPSSKVEEAVKAIEEDLKEKGKNPVVVEPKRSLMKRIQDELLHYYHGFRLLFIDMRISATLLWRILRGKTLSRREHRQLVRTTSDVFRLLPFSVFIIVPFMELLLPVFLKFFPGMLPSTFQTKNEKEAKMKAELKVKLDMAKFLQQTLDEMAPQNKGRSSALAKDFSLFIEKIRQHGATVTNEEIIKYSKLFEDEITLDSLSRPQLIALCRVLEISAIGNTALIRFQLKMKLRSLIADDKVIEKEGVKSLNTSELQLACKARGMRAIGVPDDRLRTQLEQWLQLSLHEKVPPSLLLMSRAMSLSDLPDTAQLQATMSSLPDSAALQTKGAIGEREGRVDNKTRIEILREEERKIREERDERERKAAETEEAHSPPQPVRQEAMGIAGDPPLSSMLGPESMTNVSETIVKVLNRKVPYPPRIVDEEGVTADDLGLIESAIDNLGVEKKKLYMEKEELEDLKEEIEDYKEDVQDLKSLSTKTGGEKVTVKESKGAKRLFKKLNAMITKIDGEMKATTGTAETAQELVSIEELITAVSQYQKDPEKIKRVTELLNKLDEDHDGKIEIDDILKLVDLIGRENVSLTAKQIEEIVMLLNKEELLEEEAEKSKEKQKAEKGRQQSADPSNSKSKQ